MKDRIFAGEFLKELDAETNSTRKCLERIPEKLFTWKPHERSMTMGYLSVLIADIPKWITHVLEKGEIDLATFQNFQAKTNAELLNHLDVNFKGAREALQQASDQSLSDEFYLKNQSEVLFHAPKKETISQSINHLVHHRGQLTIYMRLNDIPVPSIYGPSADDRTF